MNIRNIVIVGGGSLGHVTAGWLSAGGYRVSVLTRRPAEWSINPVINTPDGKLTASLHKVSDRASDIVPEADVVLLTVPGYANASELEAIRPFLREGCFVGAVFASSGFFFDALGMMPETVRLWGFQRVPFISRVKSYGHEANLLSSRAELNIAVERASESEKEEFRKWIEDAFKTPTVLRKSYLEVSITNSNPILHTARLYTMFHDWTEDKRWDHNILFYEEWTVEAARLMIEMDAELFKILEHLPVDSSYLTPLLEYYESHDALSLKKKLASINGFKGITSPMKQDERGWYPDFSSRYFTEDFGFSLKYIWELAKRHHVDTPNIDMVYDWGKSKIQ